jgi:hypothetical protein
MLLGIVLAKYVCVETGKSVLYLSIKVEPGEKAPGLYVAMVLA